MKLETVRQALRSVPTYLQHLPGRRIRVHRRYAVTGQFLLFEADLMHMPSYRGFSYALVCVDTYSNMIFGRVLKSKKAAAVLKKMTDIFNTDCNGRLPEKYDENTQGQFRESLKPFLFPIYRLQSDKGGEFTGNRKAFHDLGIRFRTISLRNKVKKYPTVAPGDSWLDIRAFL